MSSLEMGAVSTATGTEGGSTGDNGMFSPRDATASHVQKRLNCLFPTKGSQPVEESTDTGLHTFAHRIYFGL